MNDRRGVIFDVDGVLVDSYGAHFRSWQAMALEHGRVYTEQDFAAGFGRTSREVLVEQWGLPAADEELRRLDDRKEALYREIIGADFQAIDGAAELVRSLFDAGFAVGVGSSGPPPNVELVIDRLRIRELLSAVVNGADVTRGKPDPQVFELAAFRLGVPPARCVVVEDAPVGVAAAHAAGMACIGLISAGRTREQLRHAELVVDSLRELDPPRIGALLDVSREPASGPRLNHPEERQP